MPNRKKIVVVEDEPDILEVIRYNLEREGFEVFTALDGKAGLDVIEQQQPNLILLDLMLPGIDGLEICRRVKANPRLQDVSVIMVSAKGEETDIVIGLGIGADDYVSKPFSPRELLARVNAVLRRSEKEPAESNQRIHCDGLMIDPAKHKVMLADEELKLTATEFRLLYQLANNAGQVFSRDQLLNHALGSDAIVVDRNVDVHIRSIRKKMGDEVQFIETIRGIGYRFRDSG